MVSRDALLEIVLIGQVQQALANSLNPPRHVEPIQPMMAFLAKPSTHEAAQAVFPVRQNRQIGLGSSPTAPQNGPQALLGKRVEVPYHGERLSTRLCGFDPPR